MIGNLLEEKLCSESKGGKMIVQDTKVVKVGENVSIGGKKRFTLIAGPCVMESQELMLEVAGEINKICKKLGIEVPD